MTTGYPLAERRWISKVRHQGESIFADACILV